MVPPLEDHVFCSGAASVISEVLSTKLKNLFNNWRPAKPAAKILILLGDKSFLFFSRYYAIVDRYK